MEKTKNTAQETHATREKVKCNDIWPVADKKILTNQIELTNEFLSRWIEEIRVDEKVKAMQAAYTSIIAIS